MRLSHFIFARRPLYTVSPNELLLGGGNRREKVERALRDGACVRLVHKGGLGLGGFVATRVATNLES